MRKLPLLALALAACTVSFTVPATAADDEPPTLEEDYDYPGAADILRTKGIKLLKGDGHILLADCLPGTGQLEVYSNTKNQVCFTVTGQTGRLTLEIPNTYNIRGPAGHTVTVGVTIGGTASQVTIAPGQFRGVGQGADPTSLPATLLEIHATKA
ncbi:hypothetical protein [Actinocrispum sp. NPDC049592]|uniref:hypothetical protein n=1 Tax=Actinocrispum sp. NPDC049592 TaxID=3154835 RepID=UPI00341EF1B3